MPRFTILIPTFDHAETLYFSVATVLAQSRQDFELFIVGDGVPNRTRRIVAGLCKQDQRIRFFDNPKGPRNGEIHRNQALREARGEFVCYQTDDDLWFPDHLEAMEALLSKFDLAHTLEICVDRDGTPSGWLSDPSLPGYAQAMAERRTGFGLPCSGHTLEAFRRLPHGWRTTPSGIPTDHYMWQQFLAQPWCRAGSVHRPTSIHFGSPDRRDWSNEDCLAELTAWSARLLNPRSRDQLARSVLEPLVVDVHRRGLHDLAALKHLAIADVHSNPDWQHHYVLGTEARFMRGGEGTVFLQDGFSDPEEWGTWTERPEAVVVLPLARPLEGAVDLVITHRVMVHPERQPVSRISLSVNGHLVDEWSRSDHADAERRIPLPAEVVSGARALVLGFRLHDPVRPCDVDLNEDARLLGMGLQSIRVCLREAVEAK